MAEYVFSPSATRTPEIDTFTVGGTIALGNLFTLTENGKAVTHIATSTTDTVVATAAAAQFDQAIHPEFEESSWEAVGATVVRTTLEPFVGRPKTVTESKAQGGGATNTHTFAKAETTPNDGPSVLEATNFLTTAGGAGVIPVNGDTLHFRGTSVSLLYQLGDWGNLAAGAILARVNFAATFTGEVGLDRTNREDPDGEIFNNYLPREFAIEATVLDVGSEAGIGPNVTQQQLQQLAAQGLGSRRIIINSQATQTAVTVYYTAGAKGDGYHAFMWRGTHAANIFTAYAGSSDIGWDGYASTVATLKCNGFSTVRCGPFVTLGTILCGGHASLTIDVREANALGNITRIEITDNAVVHQYGQHSGADVLNGCVLGVVITGGTLKLMGGAHFIESGGPAITVRAHATFDASECPDSFFVTGQIELHLPCNFIDSNQRGSYDGDGAKCFRYHNDTPENRAKSRIDFGPRWDGDVQTVSIN